VLERQRRVGGIEGGLVPVVDEALGERERGVGPVLLAQCRVFSEVPVVVLSLKILVHEDHEVDLVAHIGTEDLGGDRGVVRDAHRLADVVQERCDDDLRVGAGTLGARRGLQGVRELVDGEPSTTSASERSIASTRSATRGWFLMVSIPIACHCSAVESSIRVNDVVMREHFTETRGPQAGRRTRSLDTRMHGAWRGVADASPPSGGVSMKLLVRSILILGSVGLGAPSLAGTAWPPSPARRPRPRPPPRRDPAPRPSCGCSGTRSTR